MLAPPDVLDQVVLGIFSIGIVLNFLTPYRESAMLGGGAVKSHKRIARNYLTGWFPIDFISMLPVSYVLMAVDTSAISNASVIRLIRIIRLLRLLKLARILRASRIFSRWENELGMSYSKMSLIFWSLTVFVRQRASHTPLLPCTAARR